VGQEEYIRLTWGRLVFQSRENVQIVMVTEGATNVPVLALYHSLYLEMWEANSSPTYLTSSHDKYEKEVYGVRTGTIESESSSLLLVTLDTN
jgi:hypothetical protein